MIVPVAPATRRTFAVIAVLGASAVLSFFIARGVHARRTSMPEDSDDLVPESKLKDSRPPGPGPSSASPERIDLLDRVSVSKDRVEGVWGFQDRALITSSIRKGRLQLPCIPPDEYDLDLKIARKQGTNAFSVGFVQDGRQGMLVLDGLDGLTTWIFLSSAATHEANPTRASGKFLRWNKPVHLKIAVRKTGVAVEADGKPVLSWKAKPGDLFLPPEFAVPNARTLFLGSWETVYRIDELILTPVQGTPTFLR